MDEEWRPIPGTFDFYEASSMGRMRSVDRYINRVNSDKPVFYRGKVLAAHPIGSDYLYLGLTVKPLPGKQKVHRLVAAAFLGLDLNGEMEVDHLNDDKTDNRLENLEVVTHAENMRRMSERKTHCNKGHALTPENTYTNPLGHKRCRTCMRLHDKARGKARAKAFTERLRTDPVFAESERQKRNARYARRREEAKAA